MNGQAQVKVLRNGVSERPSKFSWAKPGFLRAAN
jgi:hypothetical protein